MSGLYTMIHGDGGDTANLLLSCLGLTKGDVGRYRDCYINDGKICVYTRNGGGNREDYQYVFDTLAKHPNYVDDFDDDYDSTYATIRFSFPEEHKEALSKIEESPTGAERWDALFKALGGKL